MIVGNSAGNPAGKHMIAIGKIVKVTEVFKVGEYWANNKVVLYRTSDSGQIVMEKDVIKGGVKKK